MIKLENYEENVTDLNSLCLHNKFFFYFIQRNCYTCLIHPASLRCGFRDNVRCSTNPGRPPSCHGSHDDNKTGSIGGHSGRNHGDGV